MYFPFTHKYKFVAVKSLAKVHARQRILKCHKNAYHSIFFPIAPAERRSNVYNILKGLLKEANDVNAQRVAKFVLRRKSVI